MGSRCGTAIDQVLFGARKVNERLFQVQASPIIFGEGTLIMLQIRMCMERTQLPRKRRHDVEARVALTGMIPVADGGDPHERCDLTGVIVV